MTELKCCGFSRIEDVKMAIRYPLSAVGFILVPDRKRTVTSEQLPGLVSLVPDSMWSVGVCANPSLNEVDQWMTRTTLRALQLHGDESADFCQVIKQRWPKCKIIKVFHIGDADEIPVDIISYAPFIDVALLDSTHQGVRGGTGKSFDWRKIPVYQKICQKHQIPLWVAGGIGVDNVSHLLQLYAIDGIDVSSGIEDDQGIKDEKLLSQLVGKVSAHGTK